MKKFLALLLACLTVISMSVPVLAAEQETVTIGGKTFYTVSTVEQFEKMNGTNNYILKNDIDFGGKVYDGYVVPAHFSGILNGGGYTVHNFSINTEKDKAEEILVRLDEETKRWSRDKSAFSLSIAPGYACAKDYQGLSAEELNKKADQAMYASKAAYYLSRSG